jgi:hypothetical protein
MATNILVRILREIRIVVKCGPISLDHKGYMAYFVMKQPITAHWTWAILKTNEQAELLSSSLLGD